MSITFFASGNRRARTLYGAFAQGLSRHGLNMDVAHADNYTGIQSDVAVFYGLVGNLKRLYHEYRAAGKTTIFFDLGYWGRLDDGRYLGYHRVVVNGLHTVINGDQFYPDDRVEKFNINLHPMKRKGSHIVLAGQSAKASWVYDLEPEEWEHKAIQKIRKETEMPIYYHPKLSWRDAKPIDGTIYWPQPIDELLDDAWALVTHHSNSSLLALSKGVPIFIEDGIASGELYGRSNISQLMGPQYPDLLTLRNLFSGAAYWQWKVSEIAEGSLWGYLKSKGFV